MTPAHPCRDSDPSAPYRNRQKAKGLVLVQRWVPAGKLDAVCKAIDEAVK